LQNLIFGTHRQEHENNAAALAVAGAYLSRIVTAYGVGVVAAFWFAERLAGFWA
jgi:hypothetical protein